ncbi:MAG: hypothetical protein JSR46_11595, partial [Verrucomicrobia bacterium]|nr:hypothetical protein [Verrucomicrobiota bacterium]
MRRLLPIRRHELIKFLVLSTLFFLICLNNHILRNLKETVIITKPELGVNAIPFIKTWMMLPIILTVVKGYIYLSGRFSQDKVTYIILLSLLLYFVLFISILYPNEERLQIPFAACSVVQHWNLSLFYCVSEIWGAVVMMILFWGTCNRSTDLDQAKRFYSPILAISNLSGFASAHISISCSQGSLKHLLFPGIASWNATLSTLTLLVSVVTVAILGLFYYLQSYVLKSEAVEQPQKERLSLLEAVRSIATNLKLRALAFTIFAYYFCSGILELILKYQLHTMYSDANEFNDILNQMTICVSVASTLVTAFVTGSLLRRFSWRVSALATPLLLTIPLTILVAHYFFFEREAYVLAMCYAVYFMLSRMCKFTFFDLSKEIACVGFS